MTSEYLLSVDPDPETPIFSALLREWLEPSENTGEGE